MTETDGEAGSQSRTETRRTEDQTTAEQVSWLAEKADNTIVWLKRWRYLIGFAVTVVVVIVAAIVRSAAWAGAQQSSPGQRLTRLETTVEARFDTVARNIDSLRAQLVRAHVERDSSNARISRVEAHTALTLKIICRPITDTDLRQDCIEGGARRR
jgi:hypothetical protein